MTADPLDSVLEARRRRSVGSLIAYVMVDRHRQESMRPIARAARDAGVAGLELGFPFSDPVADGPVLQAASERSLDHQTRWVDLLEGLAHASQELPCAVMTYANPLLQRGLNQGCREIHDHGGTGLVVPDLPYDESGPWRGAARRNGLALVQMGSPSSPADRIACLARTSSAFLYLVARFGTTGNDGPRPSTAALSAHIRVAHRARPHLPVLVGFGVSGPSDIDRIRRAGADGAVVGSAFEQVLQRSTHPDRIRAFLTPLATAANRPVTD